MCVLTQDRQSFHVISESAGSIQLNARNEANWILCQMNNFTNNLSKIGSLATDTCSVQRLVWDHLHNEPQLKHCFMVPYDSYGIQLLIKNLLHTDEIKIFFYSTVKIVNSLRHAKHQLSIFRKHQKEIYGTTYLLIASTIFCWGTQVNLLELLMRSKAALRSYA